MSEDRLVTLTLCLVAMLSIIYAAAVITLVQMRLDRARERDEANRRARYPDLPRR